MEAEADIDPVLRRTELWLVRHGESTGNRDGVIQGHEDMPLSQLGAHQAQLLAKRLQGGRFGALYTSDLLRSRDTARAVGSALGMSPSLDRRLREVDTGAWSGLTLEQIAERFPEEWSRWRSVRDPAMRRGGGESYREAAARIAGCLDAIGRAHAGEAVVVVFHGTVMRLYLAVLLGMDLAQAWRLGVSNAGITRVRPYEPAHAAGGRPGSLVILNDCFHLQGSFAAARA